MGDRHDFPTSCRSPIFLTPACHPFFGRLQPRAPDAVPVTTTVGLTTNVVGPTLRLVTTTVVKRGTPGMRSERIGEQELALLHHLAEHGPAPVGLVAEG